jgi:hypothetical protein
VKVNGKSMPALLWAPYQEFGAPDPSEETSRAPAGPVTIGATGYRDDDVIVYWSPAEAAVRDGLSQAPGQVNPALLIQRARVLGIELARGNVLKVRGAGHAGRLALTVTDLTVDPDGCPVLHVSPATAGQVTAREDEARRAGGPVPP